MVQRDGEQDLRTALQLWQRRLHHLDALLAESLMKVLPKGLMMRAQQKEAAALKMQQLHRRKAGVAHGVRLAPHR